MLTVEHVINSIFFAEKEVSKFSFDQELKRKILSIAGFSSFKTRHFLNNLCNFDGCKYFEVGVYLGSTSCAALFNNKINATFCDNWCEFVDNDREKTKKDFIENINKFKGQNKIKIFDQDCFSLNVHGMDKMNVYFYDGYHSYEHQRKAMTYFCELFEDRTVILVDDFKRTRSCIKKDIWGIPLKSVQTATYDGLYDLRQKGFEVEYMAELPPLFDTGQGGVHEKDYWCGMFVCVVKRI